MAAMLVFCEMLCHRMLGLQLSFSLSVEVDINFDLILPRSKWRTTPVIEEVSEEVSAIGAAAGAVDAAEAVDADAVPVAASPRTRK